MLSDDGSKVAEVPGSKALLFWNHFIPKNLWNGIFIWTFLKNKYHLSDENSRYWSLPKVKLHFPPWKQYTVLNHNSYAQNVACLECRSKMYVFLGRTAIGNCSCHSSDQVQSQEVGVEWTSINIHLFKAEVKVMASDLSGPQKKQCSWIPEDLFMRKTFYCLFASHWSLLSLGERMRMSREGSAVSCSLFGWNESANSCLSTSPSAPRLAHLLQEGRDCCVFPRVPSA